MSALRVVLAGLAAGMIGGMVRPAVFAAEPADGPMSSAGGESADLDRAAAAVERAVTGAADAPASPGSPAAAALPARNGRPRRSVSFRRLLVTLAPGQRWGEVDTGPFCLVSRPLNWSATTPEMKTPQFVAAFRAKFQEAGVPVAAAAAPGAPMPLSVYNVYGTVTKLEGNFCLPRKGDLDKVRGRLILNIQWRLFTPLGRTPFATIATNAVYRQKALQSGGVESMLDAAFDQTLDQLLEEPAVLNVLAPPRSVQGG